MNDLVKWAEEQKKKYEQEKIASEGVQIEPKSDSQFAGNIGGLSSQDLSDLTLGLAGMANTDQVQQPPSNLAKIAYDAYPQQQQQQQHKSHEKEFLAGAVAAKVGGSGGYMAGHALGHKISPAPSLNPEDTKSREMFQLAQDALRKKQNFKMGLAGAGLGAGLGIGGTLLGFNWHNNRLEHNGKPVIEGLPSLGYQQNYPQQQ